MTLKASRFANNDNFFIATSLGLVRGLSPFTFSAVKIDVPLTLGDVTPISDTYIFPSDSGEPMEVVGEVGDTTDITVLRLDENGLQKPQETITLNGATPVPLPGLGSRVNLSRNTGSSPVVGTVNVQAAGGGNVYSQIGQQQRSFDGVYTIPADKSAMALSFIGIITKDIGTNIGITGEVLVRQKGKVFVSELLYAMQRDGSSTLQAGNTLPAELPGFSDLKFTAAAGALGVDILIRLPIILIDRGLA